MSWLYRVFLAALACSSIRAIRAMCLTLALCAFGLSTVSEALAVAPLTFYYSSGGSPTYRTANYTTPDAACADILEYFASTGWVFDHTASYNNGQFQCWAKKGATSNWPYIAYPISLCSDQSQPNTTKPLDQQCGPAAPNCAGADLMNKYRGGYVEGPATGVQAPALVCVKGCGYVGGSVMVVQPSSKYPTGSMYGGRLGAATGKACTTGEVDVLDSVIYDPTDDVKPPSLKTCADQGKTYGTVNGVGICATAGAMPNTSVTTKEDKTTQTTDASGVASAPQTSSTTYTVGNVNGVPTVTATTTKPDGSQDQVTQTQDGFCRDNPNASPCGGGGGGGGGKNDKGTAAGGDDCVTPPACTGDAIACMMIKQQYKTRCELQKDDGPTGAVALGQKLANGQDPQASTLPSPTNATQVDLSARLSNVDNMGIAAQCLPDLHIALGALPGSNGSSLNISTGPLCDFGKLFGTLNMLGTLALCAYMLRGSF